MNTLKTQSKFVKNLDKNIINSLLQYTGTESYDINRALRHSLQLSDKQQYIINNIDNAFSQIPAIISPITVYRGINSDKFIPEILAYVSTSIDKDIAIRVGAGKECCLLEILVVPGSKVLPLKGISLFKNEKEILLPRTGKFEINNKYIINSTVVYNLTYLPEFTVEVTYKTTVIDASKITDIAQIIDGLIENLKLIMIKYNYSRDEALDELLDNSKYDLIRFDIIKIIRSKISKYIT